MTDDVKKTADGSIDNGKTGESKTFTQEEMDNVVHKRVMQERSKYSDYEDLKGASDKAQVEAKAKADKAIEDAKSDNDKAIDAAVATAIEQVTTDLTVKFDEKLSVKDQDLVRQNLVAKHGMGLLDTFRGQVTGNTTDEILESIEKVREIQAEQLKGAGVSVGSSSFGTSNPTKRDPSLPTFTRAQLKNSTFYQENKKAILEAQADGRIVN